ncbi:hypothetical protein SADUNF_Sadunf01G0146000 [Salix dunnii]|uniref:Pentatricopeptide repeat-containing protein n=1 Tax=Salix dunnii TaxID=1413687 RepID=A0A835TKQ0_9ROSI|nr:hypothetical protein SADUNF_Sadunf01G0146000 [Salix dunnii]
MLSLRDSRRSRNFAAAVALTDSLAAVSNCIQNQKQKPLEEPALLKLKAERDPEKLFNLFKANAENKLVAGMIKHVTDTFHNMHLHGCKRTVKSFKAALKVFTGTRDLATIETFVNEAPKKFDIEFDIFSVNTIVKALRERGVLDKSYLLMVEMEKSGVTPDVITYTTLISAFYKN